MKKAHKLLALLTGAALLAGVLAGCEAKTEPDSSQMAVAIENGVATGSDADTGNETAAPQVYFLNFKPEADAAYQTIAAAYTEETGVPVTVRTAAGGTYDDQLASEMSKTSAPTIFQVNGAVGFARWKDYAADLSGSELYRHLSNPDAALKGADGGVYAIPFVTEGYGIIVNTAIMDAYFATEGAEAAGLEEINNFETLSRVVEDMQAKKDELGIEGVFAATSLKHGEDWRWQTHLMNIAMVYEWQAAGVDVSDGHTPESIQFSYADNYRQLFDLYLNNSTVEPAETAQITVDDSMTEFALGKAAMVQNGDWSHSQIDAVENSVVTPTSGVAFLPMYIGAEGEESQGLAIGSENYLCVNKFSSEADQKAALDFLAWLYTSDEGVQLVRDELGFIAPFDTFSNAARPEDTLGQLMMEWEHRDGVTNLPWDFTVFPSQRFKDNMGGYLQQYALGTLEWEDLVSKTVADWAQQAA